MNANLPVWIRWVAALALCGLFYHLLAVLRLNETAIVFIGLPALLTYMLWRADRGRTSFLRITLGVTIFAIIYIASTGLCSIALTPIFYFVALTLTWAYLRFRKSGSRKYGLLAAVVLIALIASLEGLLPFVSTSPHRYVEVERIVPLSREEVLKKLSASKERPQSTWPACLQMGFPRYIASLGGGLSTGDRIEIVFKNFLGVEMQQTWRLNEIGTYSFAWILEDDTTPMAQWFRWKTVHMEVQPITEASSLISYRLDWERKISPGWYFDVPHELAAQRVANSLIAYFEP